MKHIVKSFLSLSLIMLFFESYGQIFNTTSYRDTTLPRVEINTGHYDFIYPIEKDFYDSVSYTPPIDGRFFVQNYGPRFIGNYDNHQGADIWGHTVHNGVLTINPPALCMCDAEIISIVDGVDSVIDVTTSGRTIRYRCDSSSQVFNSPINIYFRHLDSISSLLSVGMSVTKGDTLGFVGESGTTSLSHLHFDYMGVPNQWGNTNLLRYLNTNRLFDPNEHPHVIGKLDNAHVEILHDWTDSTLIRIHWPHNQHINRFEFTNGAYNLIFDEEEGRASYAVFEPSIWARDSMKIFPYKTNGYRTADYYQQSTSYPAIFPNSPSRDTNLAMYGFLHIPLTADSVVNVYDFMLKDVPSNHNVNDWVVKLSDVWGYTVEGQVVFTDVKKVPSEAAGFKVYPNPASDLLILEFEESTETGFLKILSSSGKLIFTKSVKESGAAIDISELPNGIYLISLNGEIIKFIKQ
jgi:hypothetical protein